MEPARLYESPFTDLSRHGPEDLFDHHQVDQLVVVLDEVRATAVGS